MATPPRDAPSTQSVPGWTEDLALAIFRHHGLTNIAQARRDCPGNPDHRLRLVMTT